ncbi:MAG: AI-2E family transporter [Kiritimatiellae bacterium]|nr:AI-2E family transporter [Kiritimatiellia bacterium]
MELSEPQRKTIAYGLTVAAVAVVVAFVALLGWLAVRILSFLAPAITPVVLGMFLAMFFKPYYAMWRRWIRLPGLALALMMLSLLVPLGFLVWNFGCFAFEQAMEFAQSAPERTARFVEWFNAKFPNALDYAGKFGIPYKDWIESVRLGVADMAAGALGTVSGIFKGLVSLIFFAYFVTRPSRGGDDFVREFAFLKPDTRKFVAAQIDAFLAIVVSFFQRQIVICLLEGLMYGAGFWLAGVPYGFLLGFLLGVLNLVPLFGTAVCLPMVLMMASWGDGGSACRLAVATGVWAAGQFLDGYYITPKIQGDKTGLGYAGVIFSFFFWGVVFQSLLGLLLAIPLSAFCVVLWRAVKSRYIKPVI